MPAVPGLGHKSFMQFRREDTYGTAPTLGATNRLEIISQNIQPVVGVIRDPSLNNQPSRRALYKGGYLYRGTIVTRLNYVGMLPLIDAVMGTATYGVAGSASTGPVSTIYTHVFKEGSLVNSYTIELGEGDIPTGKVQQLKGAKVTGVTIRFTAGNSEAAMLQAEWSILAQDKVSNVTPTAISVAGCTNTGTTLTRAAGSWYADHVRVGSVISGTGITAGTTVASITSATVLVASVTGTASSAALTFTPTAPATAPVLCHQATIVDNGVATSGVALRNAEISIQSNLTEDRFYAGSANIDEPLRGDFLTSSMRLGMEFNAIAGFDAAKAFTTGSPELKFSDGAGNPSTFTFRMSEASQTEYGNPVEGYGVIMQNMMWEGWRSSSNADTSAMLIQVENTEIGTVIT